MNHIKTHHFVFWNENDIRVVILDNLNYPLNVYVRWTCIQVFLFRTEMTIDINSWQHFACLVIELFTFKRCEYQVSKIDKIVIIAAIWWKSRDLSTDQIVYSIQFRFFKVNRSLKFNHEYNDKNNFKFFKRFHNYSPGNISKYL